MGLFDKKECAICGGKVKGLFPWQFDGQYVCNDCYGITHIQQDIYNGMTLERFKKYMAFREENQKLKSRFGTTRKIDLGFLSNKIVFDEEDGLFCLDADLSTTIFEAAQIEGFAIFEDRNLLFEGGAEGLKQYQSYVPDRAMQLAPMAHRICAENARRDPKDTAPFYDVPEPFKKFAVEIYIKNHPYWQIVRAEMDGPIFSNSHPDVNQYLRDYDRDVAVMTDLAHVLMDLMDSAASAPASCEEPAAAPEPVPAKEPAPAVESVPAVDAVAEIKRYKELLDAGIITEDEFTAKKKQLMGI